MNQVLPNPERAWHADRVLKPLKREEVTRRIGPFEGEISSLSGGLANDSLLIGNDRVLRIYRRDVAAMKIEHQLLTRSWQEFRVPEVLEAGDDFLLLEYVPHETLLNQIEHGEAAGRALAEIHQTNYPCHGFLGPDLQIADRWGNFLEMMNDYIRSMFENPEHGGLEQRNLLLEKILKRLSESRDELEEVCSSAVLLHGDFKASNLHWCREGRLLVLDWEFAYAGPPLMDLGQLFRWGCSESFQNGFVQGYVRDGGQLPQNWLALSRLLDLVNLVHLAVTREPDSLQTRDCLRRIEERIAKPGA